MTPPDGLSTQELIEAYAKAASLHGLATSAGNATRANDSYDTILGIYAELRKRGEDDVRQLRPLLRSDDAGVRAWSAIHLLKVVPSEAVPVLEAVASGRGLVAFSARMSLEKWHKERT